MATTTKTPRNIPEAKFVVRTCTVSGKVWVKRVYPYHSLGVLLAQDDVGAYMKMRAVDEELRSLDELHQKYKFMERNLHTKKVQLEGKVPDLRNNRDILGRLQSKLVRSILGFHICFVVLCSDI